MKKILVVEDEPMLAKIIGGKLEEEQYEVTHAYDGEEAYNLLSQPNLPDLVLLDVLLPKMSGFDVLEKLKAENKTLPKVIVFSNFAQNADVERARALGAIDYIVKAAFSVAEILDKIKAIFAADAGAPVAPVQNQEIPAPPANPEHTAAATSETPATQPAPSGGEAPSSAYQSFESLQDVMPMSEVLHPGESNNNP